jgi:hypothetical protein
MVGFVFYNQFETYLKRLRRRRVVLVGMALNRLWMEFATRIYICEGVLDMSTFLNSRGRIGYQGVAIPSECSWSQTRTSARMQFEQDDVLLTEENNSQHRQA